MGRKRAQHVFFVDDEPGVRKVGRRTLERLGVEVTCFAGAADCLEKLGSRACDLLITDVRMPKMDGIALLTEAKRIAPWLPVLVVTGYADVPAVVRAMKIGAADFIEKPLHRDTFSLKVESILRQSSPTDPDMGKPLTRTELKVLRLIIRGKTNRQIAQLLRRAVRTVEDHRNHIMRKLAAHNAIELAERTIQMSLAEVPSRPTRSARVKKH
jgi:two-component system response regulator FixJ